MKKLIYSLVVLLSTAFMVSCYAERPLAVGPSDNNKTYRVEYLFEHDGCKVYRFNDQGRDVYFTNCTGNVTAISNDSVVDNTYTIVNAER